ncbi:inositol monophosphatase/fructose-1,6-bisphosphatase family protein [Beggiatoa alba B18LD]|uniref:Inositol-1-monophosphatase n=1 Tax=Beggiatoa alba B18LD TaxID=395493 RepID=I3CFS2_9GAMM|nr:inositol monophosphatase family protein [Beggiatoa alba]EIJ42465.1 inositol monophosphatase/fructose-1,6-bisphosphatase family protein [Beggiatoa alba B18LD]
MHPMLNTAIKAARLAGALMVRAREQGSNYTVDRKGKGDFVSNIDKQAEAIIIETLQRAYPEHTILAEESGLQTNPKNSDYEWIIDPLDGTSNFLHGSPHFAVSIALRYQGRIEQGVVYDPLRQEIFTASRGAGAFLNDRRIRVSSLANLDDALVGTGFPFKYPLYIDSYMATFRALFPMVSDVRRAGSAALDLAYVACGRLDGFWEIGLQEWDIAAGVLLVEEAGGLLSDFSGGFNYFKTGNIVAGSPKIFKGILQTIQPHLLPELKR